MKAFEEVKFNHSVCKASHIKKDQGQCQIKKKQAFVGMFSMISIYDDKKGVIVSNANGNDPNV